MNDDLRKTLMPNGSTRYLFFGGKGGVGKTTMATATAVWLADHGHKTTIVSTDPTVSLSAMFDQKIGGDTFVPIKQVSRLCGLNVNPSDARGVYQKRLTGMMSQISNTFGNEVVSTPCMDEMAAFDQFVTFLDEPQSDVVVFDTAPTGKTLRELAIPFDWAGFLQKQIQEGKKLAQLMESSETSFEDLERDKERYDRALAALRDRSRTIFNLVLLPERLPIEETQSAIDGLARLAIPVQAAIINQYISPDVIDGNRFLKARSKLQGSYLEEIERRFADLVRARLPLLDHDVSTVESLRKVGQMLYGNVEGTWGTAMKSEPRRMVSGEDVIEMSGVETLHPGGLDISRRIGEVVRLDPSVRVLDVSSGKGTFACLYAREFGCGVTGIDVSESFTAEARHRATTKGLTDKVRFVVGDSRALPFGDGEFDVTVNECAVGLTAIGDPKQVLREMARVTKPGGTVVIHESTWLRELPPDKREEAAARLGTTPYAVEEWKAMLAEAGCPAVLVEDWSGIENARKVRPDHPWKQDHSLNFFTGPEMPALLVRVVARFGLRSLLDLYRSRTLLADYIQQGILGYALIVARKGPMAAA